MPVHFLPPFTIDFRWESTHVITFFEGHPEYEAVEAFVAERARQPPLVRAILTRHDKSQADYLNDAAVLAARRASAPAREMHFAPVEFIQGPLRSVLAFSSARGERLVSELVAAMPVAEAFGGLTDPVGHAPDVLPVMWRAASTFGADESRLTIDGRRYDIPVFPELGGLHGLKAFQTDGLAIGILSTGTRELVRLEAPEEPDVGARWTYRQGDTTLGWQVAERDGERILVRSATGGAQAVEAVFREGRLAIRALRVASGSARPGELAVRFTPALPMLRTAPPARFAIAIDEHRDLVTGLVEPADDGFDLHPDQPAWATARTMRVRLEQTGDTVRLRSSMPIA